MAEQARGGGGGGGGPDKDKDKRVGKDGGGRDGPSGGKERMSGMVKVYGKIGPLYCCICRTKRDHLATACPGYVCNKCGEYGHWVKDCKAIRCSWCNVVGHSTDSCPKGGSQFYGSSKRKFVDKPDSLEPPSAKAKSQGTSSRGPYSGMGSYAGAVVGCSRPKASLMFKVSSFLDDVTGVTGGGLLCDFDYLDQNRALERRRLEAKLRYDREMRQIEEDSKVLEEEFQTAKVMRDAIENLAAVKKRFETKSAQVVDNTPVVSQQVKPGTSVLDDPSGKQEESRTPVTPRGEDEGLRSATGISEAEPIDLGSGGEPSGVEPPPGAGDTSSLCRSESSGKGSDEGEGQDDLLEEDEMETLFTDGSDK